MKTECRTLTAKECDGFNCTNATTTMIAANTTIAKYMNDVAFSLPHQHVPSVRDALGDETGDKRMVMSEFASSIGESGDARGRALCSGVGVDGAVDGAIMV
jgi:hypothetical protein